jgi:hypothetical protein
VHFPFFIVSGREGRLKKEEVGSVYDSVKRAGKAPFGCYGWKNIVMSWA